jgi:hypothetical protein
MFMIEQVFYVAARAGKEIIDTDDNCSLPQQALAKMRSEEASSARDQDAFLKVHGPLLSIAMGRLFAAMQSQSMTMAARCALLPITW